MRKTTSGFTIVELLIVIVVIAILAAISVVAYTGIQDRAIASAVKSDLANFAKKIEIAKIDSSDGGYPAVPTASMGIKTTKNMYQTDGRSNWYYCATSDHTEYALGVIDSKNRQYFQSSIDGLSEGVSGIGAASTCSKASGGTSTTGYSIGYAWGGTTGTWNAWTN